MLSRRNIRIKVMQVLYSISRDPILHTRDALSRYRSSINLSFELYLFNLWQLLQIASYARQDAKHKNEKLLPTEADRQFTAKLYNNNHSQSIAKNAEFLSLAKMHELAQKTDRDIIRKLYMEFAKEEEYQQYLAQDEMDQDSHVYILLQLYKFCVTHELFVDMVEDHYPTWVDDRSLIVGSMKKTLKALPADSDFLDAYKPTEETTKDFGEVLLLYVLHEDAELLKIIEPTLKNWDADRVAIIDMILLKMAIAELINFPTIPTKVTLNEFVEISKLYSTDKSKDFINGILDRLMKKLDKDGRINKEGRGLME